jgi:hypothetical protein
VWGGGREGGGGGSMLAANRCNFGTQGRNVRKGKKCTNLESLELS